MSGVDGAYSEREMCETFAEEDIIAFLSNYLPSLKKKKTSST